MNRSKTHQLVTHQVVELVHDLNQVSAVGISGSYTDQQTDSFSDIDICVYVDGDIPALQVRQEAYSRLGFTDFIYQDVDFGNSFGDGLKIDRVRCDFNWMNLAVIEDFLLKLTTDFDCAEWIPGGTAKVQALCDPHGVIAKLQQAIPPYSDARAKHRIIHALDAAHSMLYDLEWLQKAAFRQDVFSFLKYEYELLEKLIYSVFALNHEWLSDEKRLIHHISNFTYVPEQVEQRIQSIIMKRDDHQDLNICLSSLQKLFADIVQCVYSRYPDLELSQKWE